MSWKIQIIRAKPNPVGKDKARNSPLAAQLLGEWVDLKNVGDGGVSCSTLHLSHSEFGPGCAKREQPQIYWNGQPVTINVGEIARVHTGRSADSWQMAQTDREGVHHHFFAEKGSFALNNDCGDELAVWWKGSDDQWHREDLASYRPHPVEGKILQRVAGGLV